MPATIHSGCSGIPVHLNRTTCIAASVQAHQQETKNEGQGSCANGATKGFIPSETLERWALRGNVRKTVSWKASNGCRMHIRQIQFEVARALSLRCFHVQLREGFDPFMIRSTSGLHAQLQVVRCVLLWCSDPQARIQSLGR